MTSLLLYVFGCYGVAFILGHSAIAEKPRAFIAAGFGWVGRTLVELLECPGCLGFWLGVSWGLWHRGGVLVALGYGVATSGANVFLALWSGLIRRPHDGPLPKVCPGVGHLPTMPIGTGGGVCGMCGRIVSLDSIGAVATHPYPEGN